MIAGQVSLRIVWPVATAGCMRVVARGLRAASAH
jgi:hypothetical protein